MRVKELLKERGMTAKELAARLGMTETGLSIAIGDNGNPPLKRLQEIADILGVEAGTFRRFERGSNHVPALREVDNHQGRITSTIPTHGTTTYPKQDLRNTGPAGDAGLRFGGTLPSGDPNTQTGGTTQY